MNRRIKKKEWKKQTTAQQADLLERVAALEELTCRMAAEQTSQRERVEMVEDDLMTHKALERTRRNREAAAWAQRERTRQEREMERRQKRRDAIRYGALLAGSALALVFALMLPAPEAAEPVSTAEPMVVAVDPADGVIEAMAMSWEG